MIYIPDRWVVLAMSMDNLRTEKVFAGWYGGYTGSDEWKLSSGVTNVELSLDGTYYTFINQSGSNYKCYKDNYGTTGYMSNILHGWREKILEQNLNAKIEVVGFYGDK